MIRKKSQNSFRVNIQILSSDPFAMALINLFKPTGGRQTSIVVSELV